MKKIIILCFVLSFSNAIADAGPRFDYSWSIIDKCSSRMISLMSKGHMARIPYCDMFIDSFKDIHTFKIITEKDKENYELMKKVNNMYINIIEKEGL